MSYKTLFFIFLKAGLVFGGGLAVIFEMEKQLVQEKKLVTRQEFMTLFSIARIVPAGGVTALAIAYGYKYKKVLGSLVALFAIMLPGLTLTLILASLYTFFKQSIIFEIFNYSVMPAAVGLIAISAISLGKDVFHSPLLISFATVAFISTFFLNLNASLVLFAGAILGIIIFSKVKGGHDLPY